MPDGFDGVITYRLTDLGGKTRLEFISDYEYASWVARLNTQPSCSSLKQ